MITNVTPKEIADIWELLDYNNHNIPSGIICNIGFGLVGDLRLYNGIIGDPRYMKAFDDVRFTHQYMYPALTKLKEVSILGI